MMIKLLFSPLLPTKVIRFMLVSAVAASTIIGLCSCTRAPERRSFNNVRCLEIQNEAQRFYESSGFQLPPDAQIVLSCDDHSGFHWEGEYYIVFDTTSRNIATYLETSPWQIQWQQGKVPADISSQMALSQWEERNFDSSDLWYLVESRGTPSDSGNGRLMVIDPEENRVLYTEWNY